MKRIFLFLFVLLIIGVSCKYNEGKPVDDVKTAIETDNYDVVFLFEIEGHRIYKFFDGGYLRYFMIGKDSKMIPYTESVTTGKTTTYFDPIVITE